MARIWLMSKIVMEACIITAVDSILSFARAHEAEMAATIRRFVECESPSDDRAAVSRFVELVADTMAPFAKVKTYPGGKFGRLLVAEMQLPGRRKSGQVLALGHSDTGVARRYAASHAIPPGGWPAVGAGRAGYEGGHRLLPVRRACAARVGY